METHVHFDRYDRKLVVTKHKTKWHFTARIWIELVYVPEHDRWQILLKKLGEDIVCVAGMFGKNSWSVLIPILNQTIRENFNFSEKRMGSVLQNIGFWLNDIPKLAEEK